MKWFMPWWWKYLFSNQGCSKKRPTWLMIYCRARGHDNVWWFDSNGLEPDMHCQRCGEDLG